MATSRKEIGLSAKQLLKTTPKLFQTNAIDVVIKSLEKKKTKGLLRAVVAQSFSPDSKAVKPHKQTVIGLDKDDDLKGKTITTCKRIKVQCSCSSFVLGSGFEYANSVHGASDIIYGNGEPARVVNPQNTPGMCKHLVKVVKKILEKGW
jgi:hypothetical protein